MNKYYCKGDYILYGIESERTGEIIAKVFREDNRRRLMNILNYGGVAPNLNFPENYGL